MLDEDVNSAELDTDDAPPRKSDAANDTIVHATRLITYASFVVVFAAAVIGNWQRSQDVDPMYEYDIVLRTIHFGGTYFENGIQNKGPLEPFVYQAASWITTRDGFWLGISFFVAIAAVILGWAAARTVQSFGGNRDLAIAAGAVVFVHFTFGPSQYAGVLHARNMTTCLLALAWIVILWEHAWGERRIALAAAVVVGALLGIAAQTMLATAFAAAAIGLVALALVRRRRPPPEHRRLDMALVVSSALAFLSAPIWYALRGRFTEFYSDWWTSARFMNTGTGRSLGSQFGLGLSEFYDYYRARPLAFLAILAFLAVTAFGWQRASRRERLLRLGLIGWFVGAWLELVLTQRYAGHYFSVTTTPTALMIAALAGQAFREIASRRRTIKTFAWPTLALALALLLLARTFFVGSIQDLSEFRSVHAHAVDIERSQSGDTRSVRAVLDLVSRDWDPLLMWTNGPWLYLAYHRISATRFVSQSYLTGLVFLGRTSPAFILPEYKQWLREDLAESKPVAFVPSDGAPIPPGSPFAQYVEQNFTPVYVHGRFAVQFRNDVAAQVLKPEELHRWSPPSALENDTGWSLTHNGATFRDKGGHDADGLPLSTESCFTLQGNVSSNGPAGGIVFQFRDNAHSGEQESVAFEAGNVSSGGSTAASLRVPSGVTTDGNIPVPFTLIVGRRAAVLIVHGQIRAAVTLPNSVSSELQSRRGLLNLTDLRVGPAPSSSGC